MKEDMENRKHILYKIKDKTYRSASSIMTGTITPLKIKEGWTLFGYTIYQIEEIINFAKTKGLVLKKK